MTEPRETAQRARIDDAEVADTAASWFLLVRDGEPTAEQLSEWLSWLDQDPRHARAFDRIETAWHGTRALLDRPEPVDPWPSAAALKTDGYDGTTSVAAWRARASREPRLSARSAAQPSRHPRAADMARRARVGVGLAAVVVALAIVAPAGLVDRLLDRFEPQPLVLETAFSENRSFVLPDGSRVTVGGKSLLLVTFGGRQRSVALERGEAFFSVAKDAARPFVVRAGRTNVTAVGTAFNVRRTGERVVVAVAEGVVRVAPDTVDATAPARHVRVATDGAARLRAGQWAIVADGSAQATDFGRVDASQVGGWRDGRLQYDNEPLASVVADLTRYSRRRIEIGSPAVGSLRVTGTVFKGQDEAWLETLQAALPVRAVEQQDGSVILEAVPRSRPAVTDRN